MGVDIKLVFVTIASVTTVCFFVLCNQHWFNRPGVPRANLGIACLHFTLRLTLRLTLLCRATPGLFGCRDERRETLGSKSMFSLSEARCVCVFITAGRITKLFTWGEGDSGGHVLRETTSPGRGLCHGLGLVCLSRT